VNSDGKLATWCYWDLVDRECGDSFETAVETTHSLVIDAIERQLVSDVPICTFLSGGLDSSIISAVAARRLGERGERLHTFSVGYRDNAKFFKAGKFQPNSDEGFIDIMNRHINAVPHPVTLDTEELAGALYAAVDARGLPGMADVDSSMLLLCREIKRHATVALSGECADE
jgi:asparagine synthase (glutamine-hydrolysing)